MQSDTATIALPPKLIPVFLGAADVRGAWGGRGSGKTRSFAKMSAVRAHMWDMEGREGLILCGREFMNSLEDSSLEEIKAAIREEPWLAPHFDIGEKYIKTASGRIHYTFSGLDRNIDSIKSKSRILLCWVDEAEPVGEEAWVKLIPTLREEDSELWVTWNRERETSATNKRFGNSSDPRYKIIELNWRDNPRFPAILDRQRLRDKEERPEQYEHIWEGGFKSAVEGAYYAQALTIAKETGRITSLAVDPLMTIRAYWDIGGTGAKADATAIWVVQFIGQRINVLDYYEAKGQPLAAHLAWLRKRGYQDAYCILPHDGASAEKVISVTYESSIQAAGFETKTIPNQGAGAASMRVEALRKLFPRLWFDDKNTQPGRLALGWYHEKQDEKRGIGLGPEHDWCLAAGTQVLTPDGWQSVETVAVHDQVLTPAGVRAILRSGIVRETSKWTNIKGIKCTPEHRFFTSRGLVEAGELSPQDVLWTRGSLGLSILASLSATFRLGLKTAIISATPEAKAGATVTPSSFTAWSMRLCMVAFRKAMKSITSTAIRSTTIPTTLAFSRASSTEASTSPSLDTLVSAVFAVRSSAAISHSAQGAARNAGEPTMRGLNENAEPAYNLTVETDECYFVRGNDGKAYLVSNSSHGADAGGLMAIDYEEPTNVLMPQVGAFAA